MDGVRSLMKGRSLSFISTAMKNHECFKQGGMGRAFPVLRKTEWRQKWNEIRLLVWSRHAIGKAQTRGCRWGCLCEKELANGLK